MHARDVELTVCKKNGSFKGVIPWVGHMLVVTAHIIMRRLILAGLGGCEHAALEEITSATNVPNRQMLKSVVFPLRCFSVWQAQVPGSGERRLGQRFRMG